ncbi:MAG: hypothetical protein HY673_18725 [Chloroflexi bacterium]|nr:hypothetical protein [Chloroflexota bacterium]
MLYLVTMENMDQGPLTPQQNIEMMERAVIPTLEMAVKWQAEKRIMAGGGPVGSRSGVMIIEATSNEELNALLQSVPLWPLSETAVVPLVGFKAQLDSARKMLDAFKGMMAGKK